MALDQSQVPTLEIAHVLFMDVVAYSRLPMDQQRRVLRRCHSWPSMNSWYGYSTGEWNAGASPLAASMQIAYALTLRIPVP
jgi:hypothetical protein